MAHLVAECPVHGAFVSPAFEVMPGGGAITFQDVSTNCPICDRDAPFLDGQFSVGLDDVLRVLAAPAATIAKLKQLRAALRWAQVHLPDDAEEALQRVERTDPVVGSFLRQWWGGLSDTNRIAFMGIVATTGIGLLTALITITSFLMTERRAAQGPITEERVREIAEKVLDDCDVRRDSLPGIPLHPPALPPVEPPPALPPPALPPPAPPPPPLTA